MNSVVPAACASVLALVPLIGSAVDQPLEIADAHGTVVGRYFGFQSTNGVQITVKGETYMTPLDVAAEKNGFVARATKFDYLSTNRYYTTANCTGQAYALPFDNVGSEYLFGVRFGLVQVMEAGQVLFLPAAKTVQSVTVSSMLGSNGSCGSAEISWTFVELSDPVDITSLFERPFHVAGPKFGSPDMAFEAHDAGGVRIGRASGAQYAWQVQMTVEGTVYMVNLGGARQADGLQSPTQLDYEADHPYFTTLDCSGTAYLRVFGGFGGPFGMVFPMNSGQVLFYPGKSDIQQIAALSQLYADGLCDSADDIETGYAALGAPIDITLQYKRPFAIR